MGVRGLFKIAEKMGKNFSSTKRHDGGQKKIIVDLYAFCHFLLEDYFIEPTRSLFQADMADVDVYIKRVVKTFRDAGFELVNVHETYHPSQAHRLDVKLGRIVNKLKENKALSAELQSGLIPWVKRPLLPLFFFYQCRCSLADCGVPMLTCSGEADPFIARLVRFPLLGLLTRFQFSKGDYYAVLSNDTDFLIFPNLRMILSSTLNVSLGQLSFKSVTTDAVARALQIPVKLLPKVAALAGNDLTKSCLDHHQVQRFWWRGRSRWATIQDIAQTVAKHKNGVYTKIGVNATVLKTLIQGELFYDLDYMEKDMASGECLLPGVDPAVVEYYIKHIETLPVSAMTLYCNREDILSVSVEDWTKPTAVQVTLPLRAWVMGLLGLDRATVHLPVMGEMKHVELRAPSRLLDGIEGIEPSLLVWESVPEKKRWELLLKACLDPFAAKWAAVEPTSSGDWEDEVKADMGPTAGGVVEDFLALPAELRATIMVVIKLLVFSCDAAPVEGALSPPIALHFHQVLCMVVMAVKCLAVASGTAASPLPRLDTTRAPDLQHVHLYALFCDLVRLLSEAKQILRIELHPIEPRRLLGGEPLTHLLRLAQDCESEVFFLEIRELLCPSERATVRTVLEMVLALFPAAPAWFRESVDKVAKEE